MANWTIRSKTEKTSLASTDGVPMQEAGGTTKWFSLSNLATFLGIPGGVANTAATLGSYTQASIGTTEAAVTGPSDVLQTVINRALKFHCFGSAPGSTRAPDATGASSKYWHYIFSPFATGSAAGRLTAFLVGSLEEYDGNFDNLAWGGWVKKRDASGNPVFPVVATTASAANAYIAGSGSTILQSTSSAKYKTDIRDLEDTSTLDALRPVLYKSNPETVPGDDPTLDHYGFIAEELHEIDEKLVQYKEDESGEKTPNGVQYDRVVVLLVKRIQELEARLAKAGI